MCIRKRNELIAFEKIKHALTQKICDDANVIAKVEAISKVDAAVAIVFVI